MGEQRSLHYYLDYSRREHEDPGEKCPKVVRISEEVQNAEFPKSKVHRAL